MPENRFIKLPARTASWFNLTYEKENRGGKNSPKSLGIVASAHALNRTHSGDDTMSGLNLEVVLTAQSPSVAWLAQARFLKHSRFLGRVTASGSARAKHTTHRWKKENPGGGSGVRPNPSRSDGSQAHASRKPPCAATDTVSKSPTFLGGEWLATLIRYSSGGTSTARCTGCMQSLTCSPTRMAPEST